MAKNIITFESYCELRKWKFCGLNADWSVDAYAIRGTGPYGLIALDCEGDYAIVYRNPEDVEYKEYFYGSFEELVCFCEHIFGAVLKGPSKEGRNG